MVTVRLLGGIAVEDADGLVHGRAVQRRQLALLAVLATAGEAGCSRDRVIGLLWPESTDGHARHRLSDALHVLRSTLGDGAITISGDSLWLNSSVVRTDVAAFEHALERGDREAAANEYAGPFLDGFHVSRTTAFEHWVDAERQRLAAQHGEALEALAEAAEHADDYRTAVKWWRRFIAHDPLNCRVALRLVWAMARAGDRANALKYALEHQRRLGEELGIEVEPTVVRLIERLREVPPSTPLPPEVGLLYDGALSALATGGGVGERPADRERLEAALLPADDRPGRKLWRTAALVAFASLLTVVTVWLWPAGRAQLDPRLIAVAPFDVYHPALEEWRDALPGLLFDRVDGAGPWRGVAPSETSARWTGRSDPASAWSLARQVGAGLVLVGRVSLTEGSSVHVEATLLDARSGGAVAQFHLGASDGEMALVADALALEVLGTLTRSMAPPANRWTSLGSRDLEAIKQFLIGEEHYRAFRIDSAKLHYERAIALDTGFALAYRRLAYAADLADKAGSAWWAVFSPWGGNDEFRLRAGALNRGLAPRESTIVLIDSLWAGARSGVGGPKVGSRVGSREDSLYIRLSRTLSAAVREFPQDPELLFLRGELLFSMGAAYGVRPELALEALSGAVALDSGFIPPYIHLTHLQFELFGREAGLRAIEAYLAHAGHTSLAPAYRLARELMTAAGAPTERARQLTDSILGEHRLASGRDEIVFHALSVLINAREDASIWLRQQAGFGALLPALLGEFGYLHEAYPLLLGWDDWMQFFTQYARIGIAPRDSIAGRLNALMVPPPIGEMEREMTYALRWLYEDGDSTMLQRIMRRWETAISRPDIGEENAHDYEVWLHQARGHLELLRGDTTAALADLAAYRPCDPRPRCHVTTLTLAELWARRGRLAQAEGLLGWIALAPLDNLSAREAALLRGRVNEQMGDLETALRSYQLVVDYWGEGDPETQPFADEARAGIERLRRQGIRPGSSPSIPTTLEEVIYSRADFDPQ
jgi:DNA-binding SARP family transcriptional activator